MLASTITRVKSAQWSLCNNTLYLIYKWPNKGLNNVNNLTHTNYFIIEHINTSFKLCWEKCLLVPRWGNEIEFAKHLISKPLDKSKAPNLVPNFLLTLPLISVLTRMMESAHTSCYNVDFWFFLQGWPHRELNTGTADRMFQYNHVTETSVTEPKSLYSLIWDSLVSN
jgi:hypothetical protein